MSIYTDYERLFAATMQREGKPNPAKSFKGWQADAVLTRRAFILVTSMFERERAEILKRYSTETAAEKLTERRNTYNALRKSAEDGLQKKLDEIIASKRECIKRACKAPTTDDTNLLAVLNMRSKLTTNDIIHAAESVGNNLLSLGTLADICNRHGLDIPVPTAEKYEEMLARAEEFARSRISEAFLPEKNMTYYGLEFYNYSDAPESNATRFFDELDNSVFTSEQIRTPGEQAAAWKAELAAKMKGSGSESEAAE